VTLEPIVHVLALRSAPEGAFDAYVRIGEWWHPEYTSNASTLATVIIEPRPGGRVFERHRDGHEVDWGRVTAWERPRLLAYATHLAQPRETPSEIRVTFAPADGGCSVRFEHGGWTEANADQRAKFRDWPLLLRRFAALAER
jgi:Activator of Hsp90 ATPase homolog 1-like protein